MSRFKQQQELLQADLFRPNLLADYHLLKDRIFAELTLGAEELTLYERVYRSLASQILKPDVVVYLTAPLPTLLERIERRGRVFEAGMDPQYLGDLAPSSSSTMIGSITHRRPTRPGASSTTSSTGSAISRADMDIERSSPDDAAEEPRRDHADRGARPGRAPVQGFHRHGRAHRRR
jgi:hypothetical protein